MKKVALVLAFVLFSLSFPVFASHVVQPNPEYGDIKPDEKIIQWPCGELKILTYMVWRIYKLENKVIRLEHYNIIIRKGRPSILTVWIDRNIDGHFDERYSGLVRQTLAEVIIKYPSPCDVIIKK